MGKSSQAPDPYATAAAQTSSNEQTANYNAALNRVSQYTLYGNSVYSQTGTDSSGAPTWSNTISLAPEAQKQLDNQLQQNDQLSNIGFTLANQAQGSLANPVTTAGLPALQGGGSAGPVQTSLNTSGVPALPNANDYGAQVQQAQDAAYSAQTRYLDPQYANMQSDLNAQLANQGVVQGSAAWNRAQTELGNQRTQAYGAAQDAAVSAGNQEQNTLFGQGVAANQAGMSNAEAAGQFGNTAQAQQYQQYLAGASANNAARAQGLQEQTQLSTLPLNQLNALRSGTQITNPTFSSAPQSTVQPTDISGDIYKSYQLQSQNDNSFLSSLGGLFGTLGGAAITKYSDRRLKTAIRRIGTTPILGLPLYEFAYLWDRARKEVGVMADEAARVIPSAVRLMPSGFYAVDYAQVR